MISAVLFDLSKRYSIGRPRLLPSSRTSTAVLWIGWAASRCKFGVTASWRSTQEVTRTSRSSMRRSEEFGGDPAAAGELLDDYRERCCQYAQGVPGMAALLKVSRSHGLRLGNRHQRRNCIPDAPHYCTMLGRARGRRVNL